MNTVLITKVCLSMAALVHVLPVPGVFGASLLQRLYGLASLDPVLLPLMQHRAILFGLLALPLLIAIRAVSWRLPAASFALANVISFLVLAWLHRDTFNPALWRVALADALVLPMLVWVIADTLRSKT